MALTARVGLSRSSVQARIKRLEQDGIRQGYTLRLDQQRPTGVRTYLVITGSAASLDQAVQTLAHFPEVRVADSVSGDIDLVL